MTDEKSQDIHDVENRKQLEETLNKVWGYHKSNLENNDKAILTHSSSGLAITLGFFSKIVDVPSAIFMPIIYTSWFFYCASIIAVIISFHMATLALEKYSGRMEKYYLNRKVKKPPKETRIEIFSRRMNIISSTLFIVALSLSVLFFILNFRNTHFQKGKNHPTSNSSVITVPSNLPTINENQGVETMPQKKTPESSKPIPNNSNIIIPKDGSVIHDRGLTPPTNIVPKSMPKPKPNKQQKQE